MAEASILWSVYFTQMEFMSHIIAKIKGEKKGPGTTQRGALMKQLADTQKLDMEANVDREKLAAPITNMASFRLRKKAEWLFDNKINAHQFRKDHIIRLLALSCYLLMELQENMKPLLVYKQEATCYARRLTIASGCRLLPSSFNPVFSSFPKVPGYTASPPQSLSHLSSISFNLQLPRFLT